MRYAPYCSSPDFISYWQDLCIILHSAGRASRCQQQKSFISAVVPQIRLPEAVLIFITMIWGGTFLAVHHAMQVSGPFFFVGLRFATATLALTLFSLRVLRGLTRYELKAGVLIGLAIMFGYSMQTVGLQTITSSQSAFITAMYVPIVPLLQWLVLGRFPGIMSWIGILLAFTGLMLLAAPSSTDMTLSLGEILTLAGTRAWRRDHSDRRLRRQGQYPPSDHCAAGDRLAGLLFDDGADRRVVAAVFGLPAVQRYWAGAGQRLDSADHELGAAQRFADARHGDLRRRTGLGGHRRAVGRRAFTGRGVIGGALIVIGVVVSELRVRRRDKAAVATEAD